MPSTYDPILRLELQAVGENATTWGIKTNNNIELIAQAVAGHVSVNLAGTGNYTLSVAEASVDESRYSFITFSGILTGNRNVYIPSAPKNYSFRNNTTGNYTITVQTSLGTGTVLQTGTVEAVVCDGVSVYPDGEYNRVSRAGDVMTGSLSLPAGTSVSASQAMRADEIATLFTTMFDMVMPVGVIMMWSGSVSAVPASWHLCDGTAGTVDLRDKFVLGAGGSYAVGATGGAASVTSGAGGDHDHGGSTQAYTLTSSDIPAHTHTGTTSSNGDHSHTVSNGIGSGAAFVIGTSSPPVAYGPISTSTAGAHTHTFTTDSTGGGGGHAHGITSSGTHTHTVATMPPYYALAFIQRV